MHWINADVKHLLHDDEKNERKKTKSEKKHGHNVEHQRLRRKNNATHGKDMIRKNCRDN